MKFENALKKLEDIISRLESGGEDLEEVVTLFEEGSALVKVCSDKLKKAETKIEILTKNLNENLSTGSNTLIDND